MGNPYFNKLKKYKSDAIKAAEELHYGDEIIGKLYSAKTDAEVSMIMKSARENNPRWKDTAERYSHLGF